MNAKRNSDLLVQMSKILSVSVLILFSILHHYKIIDGTTSVHRKAKDYLREKTVTSNMVTSFFKTVSISETVITKRLALTKNMSIMIVLVLALENLSREPSSIL